MIETFIIMVVLALAAGLFVWLAGLADKYSRTRNRSSGYSSWRVNNPDGSFCIFRKDGPVTVKKTYEGGERYVDGHICRTDDDMKRWYVLKGFGEGILRRLGEIEYQLKTTNDTDCNMLLSEWNERYTKYRNLCISTGMWNWVTADRTTFIPTEHQISLENEKKSEIEALFIEWQNRIAENQEILDYLDKCPRKHCLKRELFKSLAHSDSERKKKVTLTYQRLLKANIIAEKKNENLEVVTRIVIHRKKKASELQTLPASKYNENLYTRIHLSDVYKVDYTVSAPEEVDTKKNVCYFTSKSSGQRYCTSLEQCTCPAFNKTHACKHMLALAMYLGYFDRNNVAR